MSKNKDFIIKTKSVKEALEKASEYFSTEIASLSYTILKEPQKNLLGKYKFGVFKVWESSLLDSILKAGYKDSKSPTAKSSPNHLELPKSSFDSPYKDKEVPSDFMVTGSSVIVKEEGIFVKLDPNYQYTAEILKVLFEKRGVLDELSSKIPEILEKPPTFFTKFAEFQGKKKDKSQLILNFNENYTKAYIIMTPPEKKGGPSCSFEEVLQFIKSQKIIFGIRLEAISFLVEEEVFNTSILIAQGKQPIEKGSIHYIKYYLPKRNTDLVNHKKNINFRESVSKYISFKKGDIICKKEGLYEAIPGTDIFGNTITTATEVEHNILVDGANVTMSADRSIFYAGIDGFVSEENSKISMTSFLHIKEDINYNTGNINVNADILITGNINPGFKVISTGSITVHGFVQKAFIQSGESVYVRHGVIFSDLKAKESITAQYIEMSTIKSGKDIVVHKEISNSQVFCSRYLLLYGKKSTIVGGKIIVKKGIIASKIGSDMQNTYILLGRDPVILDIYNQINTQYETLIERNQKIDTEKKQLIRFRKKTDVIKKRLEQITQIYDNNAELIEKLYLQLEKIQNYLDSRHENSFLSFRKILFSNINLYMEGIDIPINDSISNGRISLKNGKIFTVSYQLEDIEKKLFDLYKSKMF